MDNNKISSIPENNPLSNHQSPGFDGLAEYHITSMNSDTRRIEADLRLTLEEIARLQNALAEANMKIMALENATQKESGETAENDLLQPVIRELLQPINTIRGYLDLLLNESVGLLGVFQKRFIERISTSINHMESLLLGLQQSDNENNQTERFSAVFSLISSIEETIALFISLIRQKSITLTVDLAEDISDFYGDKDTFERVLNILLSNACQSIQDEGIILISLRELTGKEPRQILFTIQSTDEKIVKGKPLPVHLEEFKDNNQVLNGFGLPLRDILLAKNLINELHGRMDVFVAPGNGSLIRVRLPISGRDSVS